MGAGDLPLASYLTMHRYLKARGMHRQACPKRASDGVLLARDPLPTVFMTWITCPQQPSLFVKN